MDSAIEGVKYFKAGYAYCQNNFDQDFIVAPDHRQVEVKKFNDGTDHTMYAVLQLEVGGLSELSIFNQYLRKIGAID